MTAGLVLLPPASLSDDPTWPAARRAFLAALPIHPKCGRCFQPIVGPVEADHDPPWAQVRNHERLIPAHPWCNRSAGGRLGQQRKEARARAVEAAGLLVPGPAPVEVSPDVAGLGGPDAAVWDVPWLADLRDVPADATWPRLMSAPHPHAVDSWGWDLEDYALRRTGRPLRWYQRLAARRILEVDEHTRLVWEEFLLSLSRQVGKSWLLREYLGWRMEVGIFEEPQTILHTSKDEASAIEVQRPYRSWAKAQRRDVDGQDVPRFSVTETNGRFGVELLEDGSRWLVKSARSVYSFSASVALADEAWAIPAATIEDGVEPTMAERDQPQLALVSTAHRKATGLMLDRRAACLRQLAKPGKALLLEWSTDPRREDDDEDGWREASPHWTQRRRDLIADRLGKARSGVSVDPSEPDPMSSFRCQWLNQWPKFKPRSKRGQDLLAGGVWESLGGTDARERDESPVVVGVEDAAGEGGAVVAAVETTDGRLAVWGREFDGRAEALAYAGELAGAYDGRSRVLVGASMSGDPALAGIVGQVDLAGAREFRTGLPLLRSLANAGRVVHDGGAELARQVAEVRVLEGPAGLSLVGGVRADLLRALVWTVQACTVRPWVAPAIY